MRPWKERPRELRNLFNPAFCGLVLLRGLIAYETETQKGMPFSLVLLLLPLCLHKESRGIVRRGAWSYLMKTVEDNPQILVGLPDRTRSLLPYTFEALGFLMHLSSITVDDDGGIRPVAKCVAATVKGTEESRDCQMAARSLGKKFSAIDKVTIYTTFGIRP